MNYNKSEKKSPFAIQGQGSGSDKATHLLGASDRIREKKEEEK